MRHISDNSCHPNSSMRCRYSSLSRWVWLSSCLCHTAWRDGQHLKSLIPKSNHFTVLQSASTLTKLLVCVFSQKSSTPLQAHLFRSSGLERLCYSFSLFIFRAVLWGGYDCLSFYTQRGSERWKTCSRAQLKGEWTRIQPIITWPIQDGTYQNFSASSPLTIINITRPSILYEIQHKYSILWVKSKLGDKTLFCLQISALTLKEVLMSHTHLIALSQPRENCSLEAMPPALTVADIGSLKVLVELSGSFPCTKQKCKLL